MRSCICFHHIGSAPNFSCTACRTRYIVASRECKRWEAVTRSPIFAYFSQSMKGLATIRAFSANEVWEP